MIIPAVDRLSRDTTDLLVIARELQKAGAGLRSIAEPVVDTTSDFAELVLAMLGVAAKLERRRIKERTARGRADAKAKGVKFGRKPKLTPHQPREAIKRRDVDGETLRSIGAQLQRQRGDDFEALAMTEPVVDYHRLGELSDEFTALWERLQAFYLDSVAGFHFLTGHLRDEQTKARGFVQGSELDRKSFQDTRLFSYDSIFPNEFCTSGIHCATQGEVKKRNAQGGANLKTLGQLCVVSFYDFWNDYLRAEYVKAKGLYDASNSDKCLREHASNDLWGDLYYLRTSIVHHRGIATKSVAKCKLIRWFKPGDEIAIAPEMMRSIFIALLAFRNELHREQFEPATFILGNWPQL